MAEGVGAYRRREGASLARLAPKKTVYMNLGKLDYSIGSVTGRAGVSSEGPAELAGIVEAPAKLLLPARTKAGALANCAFSAGAFLSIPRGARPEAPIRLTASYENGKPAAVKSVVCVGEGAFARIILSSEGRPAASFSSLAFFLGRGAALDVVDLGAGTANRESAILSEETAVLAADSSINWFSASLAGSLAFSRKTITLAGRGASASYSEAVYPRGGELFATEILVSHEEPDTTGNVLSRAILSDGAQNVFEGLIKIEKDAQKTDSFLAGHALLLDSDSRSDAIPSLEIEANDVRATHSASSGPIDPDHIFYLMSRGIARDEATKLVALGFLAPAFLKIGGAQERDAVARMIAEKWRDPARPAGER